MHRDAKKTQQKRKNHIQEADLSKCSKNMTHQTHEWQKRTKGMTNGNLVSFPNIAGQEKAAQSPIYMSIYAFIQLS